MLNKMNHATASRGKCAAFLICLCLLAISTPASEKSASAESEYNHKLALTLSGGYATKGSFGGASTVFSGSGLCGGISIQYFFMRNLGLEAGGFFFNRSSAAAITDSVSQGKLQSLPIQVNLLVRFFLSAGVSFSLSGGYHYMINKFTPASAAIANWNQIGFDITENVANKGGYQAGLALDFQISRTLTLGIDGRYFLAKGGGTFKITDQTTGQGVSGNLSEFHADFMAFSLCLKLFLL